MTMFDKNAQTTLADLADCLRRLKYPDMRSLGSDLYPAITVVKSDVGVSDTLHVWAEQYLQKQADRMSGLEHDLASEPR